MRKPSEQSTLTDRGGWERENKKAKRKKHHFKRLK